MSTAGVISNLMLPSDEWQQIQMHWHGHRAPSTPDTAPDVVLWEPSAVASWLADQAGMAHLWRQHYLAASRGDTVRHDQLIVIAVTSEQCTHGCATRPALRSDAEPSDG